MSPVGSGSRLGSFSLSYLPMPVYRTEECNERRIRSARVLETHAGRMALAFSRTASRHSVLLPGLSASALWSLKDTWKERGATARRLSARAFIRGRLRPWPKSRCLVAKDNRTAL